MRRTVAVLVAVAVAAVAVAAAEPAAQAAAPSRPGIVLAPLATGPGCLVQSTFGTETGSPGNLEAVVQQGRDLVHYWRPGGDANQPWRRSQVVSPAATGPGCLVQRAPAAPGRRGDLDVVVQEGDRITHYSHDSSQPASPWVRRSSFGSNVTGGPAIIQSEGRDGAPGNLEVVVPEGTELVHYTRDGVAADAPWLRVGTVTTGVSSGGSIVQSDVRQGGRRRFDVVVAEGDHVTHLWKDTTSATAPWVRGGSFGRGATGAPSLIQSRTLMGGHGRFEVVVRQGDALVHWWADSSTPVESWQPAQTIATGVSSAGSLVQSTAGGGGGSFEVVALSGHPPVPPDSRVRGGVVDFDLVHWTHDNTSAANPWRRAQTVTYRGRSEKVCQLTGGVDKETALPTTNDTEGRSDLGGTDIGYPVDDGTTLRLYFGDSRNRFNFGALSESGWDDTVGISTDTTPPTVNRCLGLRVPTRLDGSFARLRVTPLPAPAARRFYQGLFNVPESGFTVGPTAYTFFFTNHCAAPGPQGCTRPAPDTDDIGRSALSRNTGETTFQELYSLPAPFDVATAALDADAVAGLPAGQRLGVYVWAVDRYRGGNPRLAYVPAGSVEDQRAWRYLSGVDGTGVPSWSTDARASTPVFTAGDPVPACIGEMHVSWVVPLQRWLMLYNCTVNPTTGEAVVQARLATAPWGPWSAPTQLFAADVDGGSCRFLHKPTTPACDRLGGDNGNDPGSPYGPYVLSRFTRPTPEGAEITFLLSTWNPYQVVVMRAVLTASP